MSVKLRRGRGAAGASAADKECREASHQKEEIMTGMMTESGSGRVRGKSEMRALGEGAPLMDPKRGLD